jgi:type VI secretion system protein ImpE
MNAKELLDAGQLLAAIAQLTKEVRAHPADTQRRIFLFELLCFAGDYQRADRQLEVIGQQGSHAEVGVQVYRNIFAAEQIRRRLFADGLQPKFLFEPPPYVRLHLEALNRLRENSPTEARSLLEKSIEARPALAGHINGQTFSDIQDSDELLGPCLEVIAGKDYAWLPFEHIKSLHIAPPRRLRDLLWLPAAIEAWEIPLGEVFLPVLYAGSSTHANEQVKLGRMTEWQDVGAQLTRGVGQRLLLVDNEEFAILGVREVTFIADSHEK